MEHLSDRKMLPDVADIPEVLIGHTNMVTDDALEMISQGEQLFHARHRKEVRGKCIR